MGPWLPRGCTLEEHVCPEFEGPLLGGGVQVLGRSAPVWVRSVDSWTPAPSARGRPLVSFVLQPEVTGEGPAGEARTLAGGSAEGEAGPAERGFLEET